MPGTSGAKVRNGDSGSGGSGWVTSKMALMSERLASTSQRSASSITAPRKVLMRVAPYGMERKKGLNFLEKSEFILAAEDKKLNHSFLYIAIYMAF